LANERPGFRVVRPTSEWQRMVRVTEDGKPVEPQTRTRRFRLFESER
jgi:hypothetical protein